MGKIKSRPLTWNESKFYPYCNNWINYLFYEEKSKILLAPWFCDREGKKPTNEQMKETYMLMMKTGGLAAIQEN